MARRSYLGGGLTLAVGSTVSALCAFVRNVIVARLISLEDYGIATTFAMTMALIEMASNFAVGRLIVQAKDGDTPKLVATAHAFQVVRGALSTLLLFAIAAPTARLFDVPQTVWAFRVIALVPIIRSFTHLDIAVQQRDMRFGGAAWQDAVPQLLVTLLAAPLALWLEDYRVMVALIMTQVITGVVVSHLVAEQSYGWAWERSQIRRMAAFGWPLLLNGALMFAIFQGDKAIVGVSSGVGELAWYGAAFSLALTPSLFVVRVLSPLMLPLLARKQDDSSEFERRSLLTVELCTIAGVFVGLVFVLAGPALLVTVFGSKYAAGTAVIGWFGAMQAARIAKSGPAIVALARGETTNPLFANVVRCVGLVGAVAAVSLGQGVIAIAVWGTVGELLAALASILLLRWRLGLRVDGMLKCAGASTAVVAAAQLAAVLWFQGTSPVTEIAAGVTASMLLSGALVAAFPQMLGLVRRIASDTRAGRKEWLKAERPPAAGNTP